MQYIISFFSLIAFSSSDHNSQNRNKMLLAIFPHPDNESVIGEVLIKYAELGYNVQLIIATDGKNGARVTKIPEVDSLGMLCKEETRCDCKMKGDCSPFFSWH